MTHRIYATGFIDIGPAVSESQGFENVDTTQTDRRTDGQTDRWTFDQFYKSPGEITNKIHIFSCLHSPSECTPLCCMMMSVERVDCVWCTVGYQWTDVAGCVQWMETFASVLEDAGPTAVKLCSRVTQTEAHTLQTHVVSVKTVVGDSIRCSVICV